MKNYLPPTLWPDFSILITIKPEDNEGGFLFAVMDALESVVEFGVSLSSGDNDYTQTIELWYTEQHEQVRDRDTGQNQHVCVCVFYVWLCYMP